MNNKHTDTPWHVNDDGDVMAIHKGETTCVATTFTHQSIGRMNSEQDASFIVRACNAHDDLVGSATTFSEIMEPFASLPPFEAMARFKELCASGDIDMLFFELARAAKASKAALAKATHE